MKNVFLDTFSVPAVRLALCNMQEKANRQGEELDLILCAHYSINIQRKYNDAEDAEQIDFDWDEFEQDIEASMHVNDYDNLCVTVYPENQD